MNHRILVAAVPLALVTVPAVAQGPAPAAPSAAPARRAAPPGPAATLPAEEGKDPSAQPGELTIARNGFFQPGALLQVWAHGSYIEDVATSGGSWISTFRIRRAALRAKGEVIPKTIAYQVVFDVARLLDFQNRSVPMTGQEPEPSAPGNVIVSQPPSGGNISILQDVLLTYITNYADVSVGQFKIPVSLEGAASASKLYFPERALVSRQFGNRRDLGLKIAKGFDMFGYTLGFYNGEGPNKLDSNDQKDLALRLELYPRKGVTAAVVGYTAVGQRDLANTKDRVEGDLKVDVESILVQAEYIHAWDVAADGRRVPGQGFYVLAGYTFFDQLQPVVRVGWLDPDSDNDEQGADAIDPNDEHTVYELGMNYYLESHACKLQLASAFVDPEQRSAYSRFDLTLAAQVAF